MHLIGAIDGIVVIDAIVDSNVAHRPMLMSTEKPAEPALAMASPPVAKLSTGQPRPRVNGGLATYAAMTERYYRARRCNSMPRQAMNSFYRDIVATHHMMVKTYGVPAVAAVMHQSESTADHQGCG